MKKAGKVILYVFLSIVFLVVILVVIAALAENKIVKIAIDKVSKTTSIPIQYEDIDFSLVHDFPYATLQCKNLLVNAPSERKNNMPDTLAFFGKLNVSVEIKPLLNRTFNIRSVEISDGTLFYKVDSTGVTNLDFLNDTTQQNVVDTSANSIYLNVSYFSAKDISCFYNDEKLKAKANIFIDELDLSGMIQDDKYEGKAEGKVVFTECSFDTTKLNLMNKASLEFDAAYDNGVIKVNQADFDVDEDLQLSLNGTVIPGDSIFTNMKIKAEKLDLGGLLKYVPENYLKDYGIRNLSGILKTEANVSGLVNDSIIPFIDATFQLVDGTVKYQDYPLLSQINLKGKGTNGKQKNNATTSVEINSLSFQTKNSKFNVSGKFRNFDKINYQLKSTVDLDLQEISAFIPDTLLQSLDGKVNATISTSGTLPDSISQEFIYAALAKTSANLQLTNVNAVIDTTLAINGLNTHVDYQPEKIVINHFSAQIPSYDLYVKSLNVVVDGTLSKPEFLHTKISDLNANVSTYNLDISKLKAEIDGDFTKPESLDVKIDSLIAVSGNSEIELTGGIKNPTEPDYAVSGKAVLYLDELQKYVPDSLVNSLSGKVSASFQSAAKLNFDSISNQLYELLFEKSNFSLNLADVNVDMPDSMMMVNNLSGKINYNADSLKIDYLKANYLGLNLEINSVSVSNMYSAVLLNQAKELTVHGEFIADKLDYAKLETFMVSDTTAETEPMNFTYKINGRFKTNSFKYEDAVFTNVSSKFLVKNNYYVLDSLQLNAFDGNALSSVKIELKDSDKMDLFFKTDIRKMDVNKIMQSFDQYIEYEDIKAENVKGIVSTKMDGKIVLKDYEPVYGSLLLNGDLTIENGALINVKPVMEVEKIPGIGLKNMDKLYFSTLNSSVFLFNNELYIPRTEIRTTSFDAMFLGMYSFGEDYEYHIRMFLGDVLSSKSKTQLKKQSLDGGFTEEDEKDLTKGRTSIHIVSKSENGKEKAGFDNKRDRLNMVAKVNLQKQMVDMRFHPALVKYNTEQ